MKFFIIHLLIMCTPHSTIVVLSIPTIQVKCCKVFVSILYQTRQNYRVAQMKASKSYFLDFYHKFLGLQYITSYWKRYIHSDILFFCTKSDRLDTNFHTCSNFWLNVKSPCQDFNLELLRHTSEGWLFFFVPSCNLTVVSSSKH